jgi:hypothetical protein
MKGKYGGKRLVIRKGSTGVVAATIMLADRASQNPLCVHHCRAPVPAAQISIETYLLRQPLL